jgi:hypothetical protein
MHFSLEDLRLLNEERKIQLPANVPPSPVPENKALPADVKMADVEEEIHDSIDDEIMDSDEDVQQGRSLRRGNDRAAERKRKREVQQEKKEKAREKAEAEAKFPKQTKQFTKLLKDIAKKQDQIKECEDEIAILDNDLREADCPRTRVLGKDRFWNRYYWFERNGMPYAGLPHSSTAEADYANGRLWIQGPDTIEREGYIDMKPEWQHEYRMRYNMTVPERKKLEEGETSIFNAHQWAYYDDPEAIEGLMRWLDTRGFNEMKLKKELLIYRDKILKNMERRKEYLNPTEEKSVDSGKRMSTRKKEPQIDHTAHRCLQWRNMTAHEKLGHLHSDPPRNRKQAKKILPPPKEDSVPPPRATRKQLRKKENLGRQGSRYDF